MPLTPANNMILTTWLREKGRNRERVLFNNSRDEENHANDITRRVLHVVLMLRLRNWGDQCGVRLP